MKLTETFCSVQGEGLLSGTLSVFVRTWGCDLRCSWCDTSYSYNGLGKWKDPKPDQPAPRVGSSSSPLLDLTPQQVVARIREFPATHVVFTGGEPMLQAKDIATVVEQDQHLHHVTVETNGLHKPTALGGLVDLWSISPKLPSSGMPNSPDVVAQFARLENAAFKFVVDGADDLAAMKKLMWQHADRLANPITLQPQASVAVRQGDRVVSYLEESVPHGDYRDKLVWLAQRMREDPWLAQHCRVGAQLHSIMYGRAKGT